jgi:hypothetical protein
MSQETPGYGDKLSPFARSLMKALGGDPRTLSLTGAQITRWGLDRPESMLNLLGDEDLAAAALKLSSEFLRMSEYELQKLCGEARPSRLDRRVRIHFWEEYENAAKLGKAMDLDGVIREAGVHSWAAYRQDLLDSAPLLAWFLSPPASYKIQLKEAQDLGLSRLMEILELPIVDPVTKKPNVGVAAIILQAWKSVDMRLNGALTQRIVQLSGSMGEAPPGATAVNMADVEKKLAELEAMLGPSPGAALPAPAEQQAVPPAVVIAKDPVLLPREGR